MDLLTAKARYPGNGRPERETRKAAHIAVEGKVEEFNGVRREK
jgi:hypothetical protein